MVALFLLVQVKVGTTQCTQSVCLVSIGKLLCNGKCIYGLIIMGSCIYCSCFSVDIIPRRSCQLLTNKVLFDDLVFLYLFKYLYILFQFGDRAILVQQ